MKKLFAGALITAVALGACSKHSEPGGRAGTDTFRIAVPMVAPEVSQGELQTVRLTLERGSGFEQGVRIELKATEGLTVDPDHIVVEAKDKGDVQLKVTAAKDAPLGDRKVMIKGTPDKGEPAETEFTVKVKAR